MRAVLFAAVLISNPCALQDEPGELVAELDLVQSMTENTCGAIEALSNQTLQIEGELWRDESGLARWRTHGGLNFVGTVTSEVYRFATAQQVVYQQARQGFVGCALTHSARLTLQANADAGDAGAEPSYLGENVFEFAPTQGSDCRALFAGAGGSFSSLPCRAVYEVNGYPID